MRRLHLHVRLVVGLTLGGVGMMTASAQQAVSPSQQRTDDFMSMWNPQVMIDRSVKQAADRYKLTPEQEQLARKMTTEGVNAFLDKHEPQIRTLIRDAVSARMSGSPPSTQQAQEWARRAEPLFEEARQEILKGNQQFRSCLSDEQKKTFDADQQVLQQQLTIARQRLDRWTDGGFDPQADWFGGGRRRPGTTRPGRGQPELDRWDAYVRGFIGRYKLDGAQTGQAMGILTDSKNRATEYWFSHKAEIDAANRRIQELSADASRKDQVSQARKQLDDLNRPVDDLFAEMQQRLNQIPSDTQRKAYAAEVHARRELWRERMHRSGGNTAVSATSQSRPSASRLAQADDPSAATANGAPEAVTTRPTQVRRPAASQPVLPAAPTTQPQRVLQAEP